MAMAPDVSSLLVPPAGGTPIYERIKAMVTTFRLRPDERVNEVELARQLGVSRTPVREALSRIAADGFLVATANRGYTVRPLDPKQIFDLYEFRITLELAVVQKASERASLEDLRGLARFTEESRTVPHNDEETILLLALDEEFHERLAALSGNGEYVRAMRSVNERIRFVRWMDLKTRRSLVRNDHPVIVRLLQEGDVAGVQEIITQHIEHSYDELVALTRASFAEIYTSNVLADYAEARFMQHVPQASKP
ncbi:MAG: GntR family transcriptional regulator [Castellaniella sp.]